MKFSSQKPIDLILNGLFDTYAQRVPAVRQITKLLIDKGCIGSQSDIVNDHIAFRTMGIPHLGIASFEKIFLHHGYQKMEHYHFETKKLDAYWYKPPMEHYPRVFISELRVGDLSKQAQKIIDRYTQNIHNDPVDGLDLNHAENVVDFLHLPLWNTPTYDDYQTLLSESEYGAWVLYNRYYLNHYTISVHALPKPYNQLENFNELLKSAGIALNNAGGEIKTSPDMLLRQSSTVANKISSEFADGDTHAIAGSYVEFAERLVLPEYINVPKELLSTAHRREGFEAGNADKIFESTFSSQTQRKN
jgi:hypothetical protein